MKRNTVTYAIAKHIEKQQISIEQISKDTGIAPDKIRTSGSQQLTAAEFINLCVYLGLKPEEIQIYDGD